MKSLKFIACLLLVIILVVPMFASAETESKTSLQICYRYEGTPCANLAIYTYQIAYQEANGTFELTKPFDEYPITIYDITNQSEWKTITATLASYIVADGLSTPLSGTTNSEGNILFADLEPGMYLTLAVQTKLGETTVSFYDFISVISQDASENPVVAYPKFEAYTPKITEYKVVKQWRDIGFESFRPKSIQVDILKDGDLFTSQILSADNNWCYRWTANDDGSRWQVVERFVSDGYTVSNTYRDGVFMIVNTYKSDSPEQPQTGDQSSLMPYVVGLCGSGCLLLLLGVWRKRKAQ
ncbi:MAG: Cna B-type domain-containing protein [Clostridia bacterium]|nr:Cna B-type domain-containing protein [Clostridia bacterium]